MVGRDRVYKRIYGSWTGTDFMRLEKSGKGRMYPRGDYKELAINENRRGMSYLYIDSESHG